MSEHEWIAVRKVMRTDVHFVDGKTTILDAMRTMKKVSATCLLVNKRHAISVAVDWLSTSYQSDPS